MKASYAGATSLLLLLLLLLVVVSASGGSLLQPLLERRGRSSIPESWFPDPFRVLEQVPFPLDRGDDDVVLGAVSLARVDWKETPHAHSITVDVPGMKREEVKVEVGENGVVTVSGERKREEESKGERWHRVERAAGRFWRQFRLPEDADLDSVGAKLEEGVLTVTVQKLPRERIKGPRVVAVGGEDKLPASEEKEKEKKEKKEKEKKKVEL